MNNEQFKHWCSSATHNNDKPLLMGIINVTPDSFSDGGRYFQLNNALMQARNMLAEGADLLDIGGESSRPGAKPISITEELDRVIPLIEGIRTDSDVCISIDTTKASVMRAAVSAGAGVINDITALQNNDSLIAAVELQVPVCLMHMQGVPMSMQDYPHYNNDVITEINDFFQAKIMHCLDAGLSRSQIILDPGFGFGKSISHNLKIIKYFKQFKQHHLPLMLGVSRKSTLGSVLNKPVNGRLIGGIALTVIAALHGVAIIRTHDIEATKDALLMVQSVIQVDNNE